MAFYFTFDQVLFKFLVNWLGPATQSHSEDLWTRGQACPFNYAVFAIQARIDTLSDSKQQTPKWNQNWSKFCAAFSCSVDMSGINGLRLFCSPIDSKRHYKNQKVLEFTGGVGDWGRKLMCEDQKWVTEVNILLLTLNLDRPYLINKLLNLIPNPIEVDVKYGADREYWGIVQMRLKCQKFNSDKTTPLGRILPPNYQRKLQPDDAGTAGALETEPPELSKADKQAWETVISCPSNLPIVGAKVQTDQEFDHGAPDNNLNNLRVQFSADMVGINNVKFTCQIYGTQGTPGYFKQIKSATICYS